MQCPLDVCHPSLFGHTVLLANDGGNFDGFQSGMVLQLLGEGTIVVNRAHH